MEFTLENAALRRNRLGRKTRTLIAREYFYPYNASVKVIFKDPASGQDLKKGELTTYRYFILRQQQGGRLALMLLADLGDQVASVGIWQAAIPRDPFKAMTHYRRLRLKYALKEGDIKKLLKRAVTDPSVFETVYKVKESGPVYGRAM